MNELSQPCQIRTPRKNVVPLRFLLVLPLAMGLIASALAPVKVGLHQIAQRLGQGESLRVVVYGTSLSAHGAWLPQVKSALAESYPDQIDWINTSGSGKNSDWGLKNLDSRVLIHQPDVVFLEFAINDAVARLHCPVKRAESNLRTMIHRIRKANPETQIILQTTNPVFQRPKGHTGHRPGLEKYYQMVRRVAKETRTLLADQEPVWRQILKEAPTHFPTLVPDGLHPNALGGQEVAAPVVLETLGL